MREQLKTIGFATAVCLVCSILLALASNALGPRQARNKANDIKTKVLTVFGEKVTNEKGKLNVSLNMIGAEFETHGNSPRQFAHMAGEALVICHGAQLAEGGR